MLRFFYLFVCGLLLSPLSAQTAYQFTGEDCNGSAVDLYADLDAGKAVVLFYYMPDCGACPPPADKIQEMAYNVMNDFPDMVKGYAFPFLDIYDCPSVQTWVDDSHVPFFAPMDSGEYQVAYYGGFGMPTVVLVGGLDHRVLFSTLSFVTDDTTTMRDSILRLFGVETGVEPLLSQLADLSVSPNPSADFISINMHFNTPAEYTIELLDINGAVVTGISGYADANGTKQETIDVRELPNGMYVARIASMRDSVSKPVIISH